MTKKIDILVPGCLIVEKVFVCEAFSVNLDTVLSKTWIILVISHIWLSLGSIFANFFQF